MSIDSDTLLLTDEESPVSIPSATTKQEPTNSELMAFFVRMDRKLDRQLDDNKKANSLATDRMNSIGTKTNTALDRIANIESKLSKIACPTRLPEDWLRQNELRLNVSIICAPHCKEENLRVIVIDLCRFYGVIVSEVDLSNMFIAKFSSMLPKAKLMSAKPSK